MQDTQPSNQKFPKDKAVEEFSSLHKDKAFEEFSTLPIKEQTDYKLAMLYIKHYPITNSSFYDFVSHKTQ